MQTIKIGYLVELSVLVALLPLEKLQLHNISYLMGLIMLDIVKSSKTY